MNMTRLPRLGLASLILSSFIASYPVSASAQSGAMASLSADAQVNNASGTLSVSGTTSTHLRVGGSAGTQNAVVYVFQIPSTILGNTDTQFATANFSVKMGSGSSMTGVNGDLYGLPYRTASTVLTSQFHQGTSDPAASMIHENFLTSSTAAYATVTTANSSLASYLNAQLQAARTAGASSAYLFLRINPDVYIYGNHWIISMAEAGGSSVPTIAYTTSTTPPGWRHVTYGGGGYATGIFADPLTQGRFYMRTDVGGANRWDAAAAKWTPITEKLTPSSNFGVDSLAVDPNNANTLYIATGKYLYDTAYLHKSTDAGNNWTTKTVPPGVKCAGNEGNRHVGERLQVDPNNSNVLFFASRNAGLWKSSDGAGSWTQIAGVPIGQTKLGQSFVTFDKNGGLTSGASSILYVGVYDSAGGTGGIWKSTNGGGSWIKMSGGALTPARGQVASDGTFYTTALGTSGGVFKAARASTTLSAISPATATGFCALAIDPANAQVIYVSKSAGVYNCQTWRSTNGGTNWNVAGAVKGSTNLATRDGTNWFGNISCLAINPFNTNEVWMGDWVGVLRTTNITNTTTPWDFLYKGHEEIVPLMLKSAPTGAPLMSASADVNGGRHIDLAVSPTKSFGQLSSPTSHGSTTALDFCETDPNVWARVLNSFVGGKTGLYSLENGQSWVNFSSIPSGATGGRIVVSATNSSRFVWAPEDGRVFYTTNRGASWTQATTAPSIPSTQFAQNAQALTSDRVNGNNFYLFRNVYNAGKGEVWRSTDGGATWTLASTITYSSSTFNAYQYKIAAMPGTAGKIWLNLGYSATLRSTDSGSTFTPVSGVSSVGKIAFGKPAPGRSNPTIFVDGSAGGLSGILRSDDDAVTWKKINGTAVPMNNTRTIIEADRQTFGRVYLGTDGSGIYVGDSN